MPERYSPKRSPAKQEDGNVIRRGFVFLGAAWLAGCASLQLPKSTRLLTPEEKWARRVQDHCRDVAELEERGVLPNQRRLEENQRLADQVRADLKELDIQSEFATNMQKIINEADQAHDEWLTYDVVWRECMYRLTGTL